MKTMYSIISVISLLIVIAYFYMQLPKFGKTPSGARLARIEKSPNYKNGAFQNINNTPDLTEGFGYYAVAKKFFFGKKERMEPQEQIPTEKTDLLTLNVTDDIMVWFGHSSYFIQIDGKRIIMDPVLSGSASPIKYGGKAFVGSDVYGTDDLPDIDYLFISHDHWDHLDYETIIKLKPKIKMVICGLGIGAHFEHWGFDPEIIHEKDWKEEMNLGGGFIINTVSARHFSGRGLSRNKALWLSYVLKTPTMKIFLGGDSGYDSHFAEIGQEFGPFDLAILENGQYDTMWRYVHLLPDELILAANDLRAKTILPVHSGKFVLGNHSWDEPLQLAIDNSKGHSFKIITPMIGERVNLKDTTQIFSLWWQGVK